MNNLQPEIDKFGKDIAAACASLRFGRLNEEQREQVSRIIKACVRFRNFVLSKEETRQRKADRPKRSHEKWDDNEDKLLLEKFKNCVSDGEHLDDIIQVLADDHGRSEYAIHSRLQKLGVLEYDKDKKSYKMK